jgi:low affinity Fe/Cu permease
MRAAGELGGRAARLRLRPGEQGSGHRTPEGFAEDVDHSKRAERLTHVGVLAAHPAAFLVVGGYVALWFVLERETLDLHGLATIATWVMTLFIQRATHRDTQAMHAKLDELVYSHQGARNEVSNIDQLEPEEVEVQRGASGPASERGTF